MIPKLSQLAPVHLLVLVRPMKGDGVGTDILLGRPCVGPFCTYYSRVPAYPAQPLPQRPKAKEDE